MTDRPAAPLAQSSFSLAPATLECFDDGVLLFDAHGHVLYANQVAHAILGQCDGLWLQPCPSETGESHCLTLENPEEQVQLYEAIHLVLAAAPPPPTQRFGAGLRVSRPSGRPSLILKLTPLAAGAAQARPAADARILAFLIDPERTPDLDEALLGRLYGVTRAETRLARELLGSGDTLPSIAARLGISHNTLKKQLRGLFRKTGTHSQMHLMKLLVQLAR